MTEGLPIVARGLEKRFENGMVHALGGIDLDIAPGERVAITGPTGSGKSTLLAIVALLEKADRGDLFVGGHPARTIRSPERWRAQHVGIVFQLHQLLPHLTVEENVMLPLFGRGLRTTQIRRRAQDLLEQIGLEHRRSFSISKLSGGERQLTAVARAVVGRPALLLADEPTGSVDSVTGERVLDLILSPETPDRPTVLLVTHDAQIAARADRIVRLLDGRLHRP